MPCFVDNALGKHRVYTNGAANEWQLRSGLIDLTGDHCSVGLQERRVHPGKAHVQVRQIHHRRSYLARPVLDAHRGEKAVVDEAGGRLHGTPPSQQGSKGAVAIGAWGVECGGAVREE